VQRVFAAAHVDAACFCRPALLVGVACQRGVCATAAATVKQESCVAPQQPPLGTVGGRSSCRRPCCLVHVRFLPAVAASSALRAASCVARTRALCALLYTNHLCIMALCDTLCLAVGAPECVTVNVRAHVIALPGCSTLASIQTSCSTPTTATHLAVHATSRGCCAVPSATRQPR
jgi:hypothetical protein